MSECKCDLRIKLVGDGCRYCNPQEYIDHLIECLEEQRTWVGLDSEEIRKAKHHMIEGAYQYSFKQGAEWAEAKLKEKNT